MNILSGVIEPDAGEVRIDELAVRFADPHAAQAAGVATIFQELDSFPASTSREPVPRQGADASGRA